MDSNFLERVVKSLEPEVKTTDEWLDKMYSYKYFPAGSPINSETTEKFHRVLEDMQSFLCRVGVKS